MSDPYAKIDLGGIAKGYIADQVKNYLIEEGIEHAYINLGGNILTLGGKTDGSNFRIGIQKPFAGAITVTNFLAHIDADKCTECGVCVEKCPRKIITLR